MAVTIRLNETFSAGEHQVPVNGSCEPRFRAVLDAFMENYRSEEEFGSAVSVVVDGRTVVDLWGGWRDAARQREWQHDTIVCMMSVSKGITGLAFSLLIDRGLVDVNEPVAHYWPEFASNGKETLPVRYILDHRAGLPIVADPLWPGAIYDHEAICGALAAQAPLWAPGTVAAYHVHTQGYLLGEIVRRLTGRTVGAFLRQEITGPLAADFMIGGLSAHDQARCAEVDAQHAGAAVRGQGSGDRHAACQGIRAKPRRALAGDTQLQHLARTRDRQRQRPRQCARGGADLRRLCPRRRAGRDTADATGRPLPRSPPSSTTSPNSCRTGPTTRRSASC